MNICWANKQEKLSLNKNWLCKTLSPCLIFFLLFFFFSLFVKATNEKISMAAATEDGKA